MKLFGKPDGTSYDELAKRLAEVREHYARLAERLQRLEERSAENHLLVLDAAEKVATRLKDRQRKRARAEEDEDDDEQQLVIDPWMRHS